MTFSGRYIANIIQFACRQGADMTNLLKLTGYSFEQLCEENLRIAPALYNQVVEAAVAQTQNKLIGLYMGESLNLNAIGLVGQIAQTSRTVKEALQYVCEFANLGCQALPMQLEEEGEVTKLTIKPHPVWEGQSAESVRQTADATIAFTLREFHTLTFRKHAPLAVHLKHGDSGKREAYETIFQCPLHFNSDHYALYFPSKLMQETVVTSNYTLLQVLVQHAHQKLEKLTGKSGISNLVKQSVYQLMKPEFPTIEQVADSLNMSVRSLQRKLKEENTSFKTIVEGLKKQLAETYLQQEKLTVSEIAYMLDYADPSAFIRSFKRWSGQTPQNFRETNYSSQN